MARRANRRQVRPQVTKPRKHETLEDRVVMSADPLLGGPMLSVHETPIADVPVVTPHELGPSLQLPAMDHALGEPDFWIDPEVSAELALDEIDRMVDTMLREGHALTGQDDVVTKYGFTGAGQTVAVIDTGIAYNHYALGGGVGSGYRVVGGYDFAEGDSDFNDDGGNSKAGHGTHVAGIVGASSDGTHNGVATGVDLVGLRVFDDAGAGYFSWIEQSLQWVHANLNTFENPITAVNMSLGTTWNSDDNPGWAMLENEFAALEAAGVFISVSAGNSYTDYNANGVSYPASSDHVIPVMATRDDGSLAYFSQRATYAIGAPGWAITSTVPDHGANDADNIDDDWGVKYGTSMAAPYVAGASVLVREAMEFVGQTGIDQWDIYDHMMATADSFFDSASQSTYKRLNLEAAIDTLMPVDDHGTSVETATNLGSLGDGESTRGGVISTLDDGDYFTFTAGVTGTVTVTAENTTHDLTASWDAWGGSWSNHEGGCQIDVVAGQTYTIALSSSSGLGHYELKVDVEQEAFAPIEWGASGTQQTRSVLAATGEAWYRVTATRAGYFTAEAITVSGSATVAIYDAQQTLLANAGTRADVQATAGQTLLLRVTGDAADYAIRMTNALTVSGGVATLIGTAGDDDLVFLAGTSEHSLQLNGVSYAVDASQVSGVSFDGSGGVDSTAITGLSANSTAYLGVNNAQVISSGLTFVTSGSEEISIDGAGGQSTAILYGSAGADTFTGWSDRAVMRGDGYRNEAIGFSVVHGFANGADDTAYLHGSNTPDTYRSYDDRAIMSGATYYNRAMGFSSVTAYAVGAADTAWMYGSTGADEYRVSSTHAVMSGGGFKNTAVGFENTYGIAEGAGDQAWMYGSAGADTYSTYDDRVVMSGADYYNRASGFELTYGFANDASDTAWMFGSDGVDDYRTYDDRVVMSGGGYYNRAEGFTRSWGYGTSIDRAWMHDSVGLDEYRTSGSHAIMSGSTYYNAAIRFGETNGYATTFGDQAWMYGSSGSDTYSAYSDRVEMTGAGYTNTASGFTLSYAFANGASDVAYMYDSDGTDAFRAYEDRSIMSSTHYYNRVIGFLDVTAYSTAGNDTAHLYDSAGDDDALVRTWGAQMDYASGARATVDGFESVYADGSAGGSNTLDEVAVDYYFGELGSWA